MRLSSIPKVLLGAAAGAYVVHRARKGARRAQHWIGTVPPPDPDDPVQALYSEADPAIELDLPAEAPLENDGVRTDMGDLYGMHTPRAEDVVHPDADHAMRVGQNWTEALAMDSVEGGTLPEHELDMDDDADNDRPPHHSDTRDRPVADRGSGGPGGT